MPATSKNTYGYDHNQYCIPQLKQVLGLQHHSRRFDTAKNNLKILVDKYLVLDKTPLEQQDALALICKKLKKKYPDTYGGEDSDKKLYFASRTAKCMHFQNRRNERKRRENHSSTTELSIKRHSTTPLRSSSAAPMDISQPKPSTSDPRDEITTPLPSIRVRSKFTAQQVHFALPLEDKHVLEAMNSSLISQSGSKPIISPRDHVQPSKYPTPPPTASGSKLRLRPPSSQPTPINSEGSPKESGIPSVHNFLLSCKPPMGHFLSRFVNFGWRNKDFLYAMSAWPDSYRCQMLRRVLADKPGEGEFRATEAEIAILDYHLMKFGFVENESAEE